MKNPCKPFLDNPDVSECEGGWSVPEGWIPCSNHCSDRCPAVVNGGRLEECLHDFLGKAGFGQRYHSPEEGLLFGGNNLSAEIAEGIKEYWLNIGYYMKQGEGFLLCGPVGTGKTFSLALTALKTWWPKEDVKYIFAPRLFNLLHEKSDKVEDYETCSLLLLDDFGAEYSTDWNTGQFASFMEYRHANMLSTCITSNNSVKDLAGHPLYTRVVDRWRETCKGHIYELSFPSLRGG